MAWVAAAIIGAAVVGAGASLIGGSKAAKAQKSAAKTAAAASQSGTDASIAELKAAREESKELRQPFIDLGSENIPKLNALAGPELQQLTPSEIPGMEQLDAINPLSSASRGLTQYRNQQRRMAG